MMREGQRHEIIPPGGKMYFAYQGNREPPIGWVRAYDKPTASKIARKLYANATVLIVPTRAAMVKAISTLPEITVEGLRTQRFEDVKGTKTGGISGLPVGGAAAGAHGAATVQRSHPFGTPSILRGGARGPEGGPERDDASYRFTLYIDTDNDAFTGAHRENEVARILTRVAHDLITGNDDFSMFRTLRDMNGNDVGRAKFERKGDRLRPGTPDPRD